MWRYSLVFRLDICVVLLYLVSFAGIALLDLLVVFGWFVCDFWWVCDGFWFNF